MRKKKGNWVVSRVQGRAELYLVQEGIGEGNAGVTGGGDPSGGGPWARLLGSAAERSTSILAPRVGAAGVQQRDEEKQEQRPRCNLPGLSLCSASTAPRTHRRKNQILDRGVGAARGA